MSANPPLQARAGRNSPEQSLAPEYTALLGILKKLTAAVAPGVDLKLAEGGDGVIFPLTTRTFMGVNAGAAELSVTISIRRDSDGAVFQTDVSTLGPGPNTSGSFTHLAVLPEGFSLWVNTTLTAGVYGGDAEIQTSIAQSRLLTVGPKDLSTTSEEVAAVSEGHTKLLGLVQLSIINRDTIAHDVEVYLSNALGDTLIGVVNVLAGANGSLISGGMTLNSGETLKARIPVAIATAGRSVTIIGMCPESNLINE